jgi:hypothetical protein
MELEHRAWGASIAAAAEATPEAAARRVPVPGKRTLTEGLAVQRREDPDGPELVASRPERSAPAPRAVLVSSGPRPTLQMLFGSHLAAVAAAEDPDQVHAAAAHGTATPATRLPYLDRIQEAFGPQVDLSGVQAHLGANASAASNRMGARAFATGNDVVFSGTPDLHTVAHEVAHVVQQRRGVQLKGGIGAEGDVYERHADEVADRVVAGRSAADLLAPYLGGGAATEANDRGAGGTGGGVQRKPTVLGVAKDLAGSTLTHDLVTKLIVEHGAEKFKELILKLAFWAGDTALSTVFQMVADTVMSEGLKAGIATLASYINPFIGWLGMARTVIDKIPAVLRNVMGYGIGRAFVGVTGGFIGVERAEALVNEMFIGGDITRGIATAYTYFDDLLHRPGTLLYNLTWARWSGAKPSTAAATTASDGSSEKQQGSGEKQQKEDTAEELAEKRGPIWLDVDAPTLARFTRTEHDHEKDSGGLQLPFNVGLDLFGVTLSSTNKHFIQLPWSGGFNVEINDVAINGVPELKPVFSVGTILLPKVRVSNEGLQSFQVVINNLRFANGAAVLPSVSATWSKDSGFLFKGNLDLTIFDTLIKGTGSLQLAKDGTFTSATLGITAPGEFVIIPDLLVLNKPGFDGGITSGGDIMLRLSAGVDSDLTKVLPVGLKLKAEDVYVEYANRMFAVGLKTLAIDVGEHVQFRAAGARADRERITVDTASLMYVHDATAKNAKAEGELDAVGINPSIFAFVGVNQLRIGGVVQGLRIGARQVTIDQAKLDVPKSHAKEQDPGAKQQDPGAKQQDPGADKPLVDRDKFGVDKITPVISKIGAKVFGITGELDIENKRGSIAGDISYEPPLPEVAIEYPIVPGLNAFASLAAIAKLGAKVGIEATVPSADRFKLTGAVDLNAMVGGELKVGASAGVPWLGSLTAAVFGNVKGTVGVKSTIGGVLLLDREARTLKPSPVLAERPHFTYDAGVKVTADVGVVVQASALVVVKKELWRYTFKSWTLGEYGLKGEVRSGDNGTPDMPAPEGRGFADGVLPPKIDHEHTALDEARAELAKPQPIHQSAGERRKLLTELYLRAEGETVKRLDAKLEKHAQARTEHVAENRRLIESTKGGVIPNKDAERSEQRSLAFGVESDQIEKLRAEYREISLRLTELKDSTPEVLEGGTVDIAALEERIRTAEDKAKGVLGS